MTLKNNENLYALLLKSTDRKCILNDMAKELYHLEQQMKEAIKRSGMSCYQISKTTGVSEAQLSLFMNGKRSLTLKSASKIAKVLKLELKPRGRKRG
jgi:transcriptional regulator with XRE-family HTH domain